MSTLSRILKNRFVQIISIITIISAVSLITFFDGPNAIAQADTLVCGTLNSDTNWTQAGSPYIVTCDVQVANGVTLTIESNVEVKFDAGNSLLIDGALIADDCIFTSNEADPNLDDWDQIFFSTLSEDAVFDENNNYVSGSKIQHCIVEYAGNGANGAIETESASPFIDNNVVRNNGTSGVHAIGRSPQQPVIVSNDEYSFRRDCRWG